MTSYTDATEIGSTGEGKRNRKTQALSALLSATALGVFLEGCSGGGRGGASAAPHGFGNNSNNSNDGGGSGSSDGNDGGGGDGNDGGGSDGNDGGGSDGNDGGGGDGNDGGGSGGSDGNDGGGGDGNDGGGSDGSDGGGSDGNDGGGSDGNDGGGSDGNDGGGGDGNDGGGSGGSDGNDGGGSGGGDGNDGDGNDGDGNDGGGSGGSDGNDGGGGDGNDGIRGFERNGDDLYFRGANGFRDFFFARAGNNDEDVTITVGGASETLEDFVKDRYTLHYGSSDTELGKLFVGTDSNDVTLTGSDGADVLIGLAGEDILQGGLGNDILQGGAGDDTLQGGAGADEYHFSAFSAADQIDDADGGKIYFNSLVNANYAANDFALSSFDRINSDLVITLHVNGLTQKVTITNYFDDPSLFSIFYNRNYGDTYDRISVPNIVVGTDGSDTLIGTIEGDLIRGLEGADTLYGRAGDDLLQGGAGADILDGEAGEDTAIYAAADKGVRVNLALSGEQVDFDGTHGFLANNNEAVGDRLVSIEHITGSNHDDWLTGDGNDNVLWGNAGNDRLDGGEGEDTASYESSSKGVRVDLTLLGEQGDFDGTHGFARNENEAVGDVLTNIERIVGSSHADWFTGDGKDNTLRGFAGNDRLEGGAGDDNLFGGAGKDRLEGGVGNDRLEGGTGYDTASYESSSKGVRVDLTLSETQEDFDGTHGFSANNNEAVGDRLVSIEHITGSNHNDWLTGDGDYNELYGLAGNDALYGNEGGDWLEGGEGADILDGGDGRDTASYAKAGEGVRVSLALSGAQVDFESMHGFSDNNNEAVGDTLTDIEIIWGSDHNDWLTGDGKDNALYGRGGSDRLEGGAGDDTLYGGAGVDTLYGGAGVDTLYGNEDNDELNGGAGADTLEGGAGDDELHGGADEDTYVFRVGDGTDTIEDVAGDTMTLRFEGTYGAGDFTDTVFSRNGDDLVITLNNDKITIFDAYDTDPNTGTGNAAFTINIEYGEEGGTFTRVEDIWSAPL